VSLMYIVPIFLYLSIGMHASIFLSEVLGTIVSDLFIYYPCYQGLGRILVIFYVLLSLSSLGLTMRIG
jgi:hypothetical protein